MARSRTIKRPRKKSKPSVAFLPESMQIFIARRLVDLIALAVLGFSAYIIATLASYNHTDPSWNTAASAPDQPIANIGGATGAWVADILLQTLGVAAFIPAIIIGIWSLRIFRRQSIRPVSLRIIALLVTALLASVALAQIPAGNWSVHPYLGSSAGTLILNKLVEYSYSWNIPYGHNLLATISGGIALVIALFAAAVTSAELSNTWFRIKLALFTTIAGIFGTVRGIYNWVMHYNDDSYKPEPKETFSLIEHLKVRHAEKLEERAQRAAERAEEKGRKKHAPVVGVREETNELEEILSAQPAPSAAGIPVINHTAAKPQVPAKKPKDTAQTHFVLNENSEWEFPPLSFIQDVPAEVMDHKPNEDALRRNAELLQSVLADFNIKGEIVSIHPGPVVTLYELEPAPGTKSSRVISLSDDIARSMSAISVRCAVVPGRNVIGIELPNKIRQTVYMKEMLESRLFEKTSAKLPLILGKDIGGQPILADLAKMPHLLVAGTTGSGKSVAVNTMIMSLLFRLSPEQCRFIMIDPKMLELSVYDDIPHLLSPVVTEPGKAVVALKWAVHEMENRYRNMSKLGVRNIEGYNQRIREALKKEEQIMHKVQTGFDPDTGKPVFEDQPLELAELPYIVIIVDEFADLMLVAGKDVENAIQRLAQMARAAGLHLIMATQRPSVDVITGVIKANFPTRISFQVTSKIDSRTILGDSGAEQLLGMGDMLYMAPGGRITRVHGPFVSDGDVEKTTTFLRTQATPAYIDSVTEDDGGFEGSEVMAAMFGGAGGESSNGVDELYDRAVAIIAREGKASTSFVQRHLQIGYNRAARIIEEMEKQGVISPANAVGKREVLIRDFSDV